MWYATTKANGSDRLQKGVCKNFLPRFGFAYQLGDKTMIRGGIGLYTFPWNVDTYGGGLGQASAASGNQTDSTGNVSPVVILSSDGNTNYQGAKGAAINSIYKRAANTPDALNGQSVGFLPVHGAVPATPLLELDHSAASYPEHGFRHRLCGQQPVAPAVHDGSQSGSGKPSGAERCGVPSV